MKWWRKIWKRHQPSPELKHVEQIHQRILDQADEVDTVTASIRHFRARNGLVPLIEKTIRNPR